MSEAPERIWAEPDGYDIIIHNGAHDLDQLISTGYLYEYVRADRIEELEAENARLRDAVYIDDLTATLQGKDRAAAIAGMERALDLINADLTKEAKASLRTTLAELKGEK